MTINKHFRLWVPLFFAIRCLLVTIFTLPALHSFSQNSMTGDGFGGRLWYRPYNYTVGSYSAYTVCGDSAQLYGWGSNSKGQLGDGTNSSTTNPVKAIGMTDVRYYSTGYNMGAIKYDSSGWVWGQPLNASPRKIIDKAKFVDAGSSSCTFVKYDGTVWSVGVNGTGTFGNDSINNTPTYTPVKMKNINTAVRVANGGLNIIVLLSNGTLMATGMNNSGGLGNGTSASFSTKIPVAVSNLKKIVDIKSNAITNIALDSFGDVYAWGAGGYGSIGNGSTTNVFVPMKIGTLKNIVAISGSNDGEHFLALDVDHNCYAWGYNGHGTLGDSSNINRSTPKIVARDVVDIMAGETFSYLVKTDGTLWATGRSNGGSIWMNLRDSSRTKFTQIDPTIAPLNLCNLSPFAGNYFSTTNTLCVYDSIYFRAYKNDSFNNHYWTFGDGTPVAYGKSPVHKFSKTGIYNVIMISTHIKTGKKDTVNRKIEIHDAYYQDVLGDDTTICGKVMYLKSVKGFDDEFTYQWNDGSYSSQRRIDKPDTYSMKITNEHGCYSFDTFRVYNHAVPKARFKANTYSMCVNSKDSIKFTNFSICTDSIAKCIWDFTESTISSTDSVVYFKYKKAGYYPVFLSVYTKYGCRNDTLDVFDILPAPKPLFDLKINDSCFNGNSISLKNNTLKDTLQNPKFKWYFSEGYVISNTTPTGTRSYASPGKYYIDLIYVNANQCRDTLRKKVTIYEHPVALFNVKSPVCSRASIPFSNVSTSTTGPLSSMWEFGDRTISLDSSPSHQYAKKGTYNVQLTSISDQGCKDSITKKLTVYSPPKAAFNINDTIQCLYNNLFKFTSASKADSGQLIHKDWYYSDNTTDTGQTPADKIFTGVGKFMIRHTVEDLFGCKDTSDQFIHVKNGPTADFTINDPSQCENLQNFTFSYLPKTGNDSIVSMDWRVQTKTYPNQSVLTINNLPSGKTAVDLILKTQFGCPGLSTKYVVVNPKPKVDFSINNAVQCFNEQSFQFTNTSTIASGNIVSDLWNLGDNTFSSNVSPPAKTYGTPGTYTTLLKVISDSGCIDSTSKNIVLHSSPFVDIGVTNPVCLNEASLFKNKSSINSGTIASYQWDFGDNQFSGDTDPSHTYLNDGTFNVTLKAISDQGCESSVTFNSHALVYPLPVARFSTTVSEGNQNNSIVQFTNTTTPSPMYSYWNFGKLGNAIHDSSISVQDTCTIHTTLWVTDIHGCKNSISKSMFASGPLLVFFPNAFTPNTDEINEFYAPNGVITTTAYMFRIYNRWGEEVFQTQTPYLGWDGQYQGERCEDGVYTYLLNLKDSKGQAKTFRGTFTLLY